MLPPTPRTSFASDNAAGALPEVLEALVQANSGAALAYGDDDWTRRVEARFDELFGREVVTALVWGGTGANVVALHSVLRPWDAVVCARSAHINVDECGAIERICGAQLIPMDTADGKLTPDDVSAHLHLMGDEHHAQPRVVSITQSSELGTLYQPAEIAAITDVAHRHGLLVHMDGARLANATAATGGDVRAVTTEVGVDLLSFGATKAGAVYGEAVVFLDPALGRSVRFARKQAGQLPSKMRFVAAQIEALLAEDRWIRAADHANHMARRLADGVAGIEGVELSRRPEVNAVFARVPGEVLDELRSWSAFWDWDATVNEVRWMTHHATTPDDVDAFVGGVAHIVAGRDEFGSRRS